ncbi:MAG TPA: DUF763 domain-containing protein [Candidatus Paceibacterota bacterium]
MYRGVATMTLDTGRCPPWLFERMVKLGREMTRVLIEEYGPDEYIKRIADPVWFQSLGTVLAFDWNASGLTTILTAALKEAIRGQEREWGVFIAGGKGKTSRKTPEQIHDWGVRLSLTPEYVGNLEYNSKMAAKVDSALVQDGYQLYHHSFFFSRNGAWTVVQQGMNKDNQTARRYHWFSENAKDLVEEPHSGISSQVFGKRVMNLVSKDSAKTRQVSTEMVQGSYDTLIKDIQLLRKHYTPVSKTATFKKDGDTLKVAAFDGVEFKHHGVEMEDFSKSKYLEKILAKVSYEQPNTYEKLLVSPGVGPKTIRALSLVAEIIYGAQPSYDDPARYSFAHGGKDATPYPVDRDTYDQTIATLQRAVRRTRLTPAAKDKVLRKLSNSYE